MSFSMSSCSSRRQLRSRALWLCPPAPELCLHLEVWVLSPMGAASPLLGAAPLQPGELPRQLWLL